MDNAFAQQLFNEHLATPKCPSPQKVGEWFEKLLAILFPGTCEIEFQSPKDVEVFLAKLETDLSTILVCDTLEEGVQKKDIITAFFDKLPTIKNLLDKDVESIFQGDPAAKSYAEVTRSYPGFFAIASHRIAHELHKLNISLIPRMISELSKSRTGIDIHPGAKIGEYFCIDHGTGVVIGETSIIGNNVKLYQGVTLGALSVAKQDAKKKRHPTIEDSVVIYAGATILGGKTTVGKNSMIGGNVWITKSVPPNSKLYYKAENHSY
ncbi:MAG: serine acetyltransferase [Flavobacteriales bacterium]|nr:serine acetyltransferase [Flavobacteriales bacterium]|tara:strand:+ start:923 stop:1717 length:795 start_codon:yes stop_codon:yes gene_type:complete